MRKLIPVKDSVVCKRINDKMTLESIGGIQCRVNHVDLYEILDFYCVEDKNFNFSVGDIVMSNSIGDEIEINPSEIVYLFKTENIMCKVEDF
jgi:co-chaperonin GroES (HSP10)